MGPRRRPGKDSIKRPRDVVRGVSEGLQNAVPPPDDSFVDGIEAERALHRMDPTYGDRYGLGPFVEPSAETAVHLGGRALPIKFQAYWHAWFARQTPERLAEIDEMVDERLEREAVSRFLRRVKHLTIAAVIAGFAGARWFSDQLAWIMERLPVLREIWHLITGAVQK